MVASITVLVPVFTAVLAAQPGQNAPAQLTGNLEDSGVFAYSVTSGDVGIPCRLTFLNRDGSRPTLFTKHDARPSELAVREHVVYTLSGAGSIRIPPGEYTVWASHGLEWSAESQDITIRPGERSEWRVSLTHEIDTSGWVAGDYHLHTLTHSGHGDSNMPERIISLVGEGVEFAVATDHNHNTDYDPILEELGADGRMRAVVGNEISTPIGHFNAFPLDPEAPVVPHEIRDGVALFALIRDEVNEFGVTPIIQLNHPRWDGIDFFNEAGLDPLTGEPSTRAWSDDFDSIEILNENEGWGYFDPATASVPTDAQTHSVLQDWFNLLNRGHRYAAVGNSDSHAVASELAGVPRNYTPSSTDDPALIDPSEVARMIRANRVFTTTGPFVEFSLNGVPMGGDALAHQVIDGDANAELSIRVQAASWIDCDRVRVIVNGVETATISVPDTRSPERLNATHRLRLEGDSWVCVLVEGDQHMAPVVHDQSRPILPLAVTNPVWVDVDRDGSWMSPLERARRTLSVTTEPEALRRAAREGDAGSRAMLAIALESRAQGEALLPVLLDDHDERVRRSAARAAERLEIRGLITALQRAYEQAETLRERIAHTRAIAAVDPEIGMALVLRTVREAEPGHDRGDLSDLLATVPGADLRSWLVAGYFPVKGGKIELDAFAPERQPDQSSYQGAKAGGRAEWELAEGGADGYVNLLGLEAGDASDAIAYARCRVHSPDARSVLYSFGSDDGAMIWLNGRVIHSDSSKHGASPDQVVAELSLEEGANDLLVKVRNGTGDFGFYFRLLDTNVSVTAE